MTRLRFFIAALLAALLAFPLAGSASDVRLIMVEQPGCAYCAAWNDEIAPAYPNTEEGAFAPLQRADLHMGPPEGVTYDRRVNFTPTFILVEAGEEIGRLEGYPGQDFFWPLYTKLLQARTDFRPGE